MYKQLTARALSFESRRFDDSTLIDFGFNFDILPATCGPKYRKYSMVIRSNMHDV